MGLTRAAALGALLAAALGTRTASADAGELSATSALDLELDVDPPQQPRLGRTLLEVTGMLAIGTGWYWANTDLNSEDWELQWDAPSWTKKLFTSEGMSFDTNAFDVNAVKHPFGSVPIYQAGRANGYGPFGSTVILFGSTLVWEYLIEFKEVVSGNDLVVNVGAGLGLGEPLYQLAQHLRQGDDSPAKRVVRTIFSPVDGLHDWIDERPRLLGARSWRRFRLMAGTSASQFQGGLGDGGDGGTRQELVLGLDLALVVPAYVNRPIDRAGWTRPGAWTRVVGQLRMGDAAAGTAFLGSRVRTQTSLLGHHAQTYASARRGWARFVGLGSAFEYDTRRLPAEWDQIAAMHLVGPQLEVTGTIDGWTLRAELAAYLDFSMIQAHALGPFQPFEQEPPYSSTILARGYYYGAGGTALARVRADHAGWELELEGRELRAWSLDGWDRGERLPDAPETPVDLADQRYHGRGHVGYRPYDGMLGVGATVEGVIRRGTYAETVRRTEELTTMFGIQLAL